MSSQRRRSPRELVSPVGSPSNCCRHCRPERQPPGPTATRAPTAPHPRRSLPRARRCPRVIGGVRGGLRARVPCTELRRSLRRGGCGGGRARGGRAPGCGRACGCPGRAERVRCRRCLVRRRRTRDRPGRAGPSSGRGSPIVVQRATRRTPGPAPRSTPGRRRAGPGARRSPRARAARAPAGR